MRLFQNKLLLTACENKQLEIVSRLIEQGVDINTTDEDGVSCVFAVAEETLCRQFAVSLATLF